VSESLSSSEQGFVLGAALLGLRADATAGLEPRTRARCAEALAALAGLDRNERAAATARMLRALLAPVPRGLETMHPGWIEPRLAGLPTPLLLAVVAGWSRARGELARALVARREESAMEAAVVGEDALRELRRAVCVGLLPLPDDAAMHELVTSGAEALARACAARGATHAGVSLQGAEAAAVAGAMVAGLRGWAEDFGHERARALAQRLPPSFAQAAWPEESRGWVA